MPISAPPPFTASISPSTSASLIPSHQARPRCRGGVLDVIMKCVQQQGYDILSLTFNFRYLVADGVECETGAVRQQLRELRTVIGQARDAASKAPV